MADGSDERGASSGGVTGGSSGGKGDSAAIARIALIVAAMAFALAVLGLFLPVG